MEKIHLYQDSYMKSDLIINRGDPVPQDLYALIIFVCLFNREGKMLIQRRQLTKKGWPGMWDISCGGAVSEGETSLEAAVREVREELGLTVDSSDLTKIFSLYYPQGIHDIYASVSDYAIEDVYLQEEEVMDARFADLAEIEEMMDDGVFIPVRKEFIRLLFCMKDNKGILI